MGSAILALALASPLAAQDMSATVVAETGGDDVNMLLGDLTGTFGSGRILPVISAQAYVVSFPVGDGSDEIYAFAPAVGVRARSETGFLQGTVGYSLQSGAGDGFPFFGGGTDGVTTGVHAEYWGTGAIGLQGIGSYNWGSEYLWSRGRGTFAVADLDDGAIQLGAEAVWQGDMGSDAGAGYEALQLGPVFRWVTPRLATGLSGGWKSVDGAADDTWYLHLELTVPIRMGGM